MKIPGIIIALYLVIQTCNSSCYAVATTCQDGTGKSEIKLTKKQLTEDSRQLLDYIESIHPDPYMYSGGKVEFHRSFQEILSRIPGEGLTKDEYISLIRPFIASISDGHTTIISSYEFDRDNPGGLPFGFGSVEKTIFVDKVFSKAHKHLLGAKLESVEDIPFSEIMERLYRVKGIENDYHCLMTLKSYLRIKPYLSMLIPEWKDNSSIKAGFTLTDGSKETISLSTMIDPEKKSYSHDTEVETPDVSKGFFNYAFTGKDKKCVILKVDELTAYREMFEANSSKGDQRETISVYYKQFNNREAPEDFNELLAGIPSATELFIRMLNEMKENNTEKLIVDLSKNTGGSSLMSEILVYLLYGQDALVEIVKSSPPVRKLSPFLLESQPNKTLGDINAEYSRIQSYQLTENDYDFSYEKYIKMATSGVIDIKQGLGIKYGKVPSFMKEIMSGENSGLYAPGEVIVASSHNTFSSAFTFMLNLHICGARIAGSTSGQSGNGFGNLLIVNLKNSNISLAISKDAYKAFPEKDRERKVLEPDFLLSYEKLREYGFDPNAELRLAMEILDLK